eukprot:3043466-Alexandrium_andersonii.AAC.1
MPGVALNGLVPLPREADIVDLVWIHACQAKNAEYTDTSVAKGLFCDPTQSWDRCGMRPDHLSTQLTSSRKYSFEYDRVLVSADMLS